MPHPVHIHANNLGLPGNWTTTLETMKVLEGHRGHMTHIQFHSYGGGIEDEDSFSSKVAPLAEYVNAHPNLTVDVGQVIFGETTSMTGDGPLGYYLSKVYKTKWFSSDTELEAGCGIAPIEYKNTSLIHAWQWAIGLEWYLLVKDPWRVVMSTDHPNGGSFLAYPQIIRLLMDRTYRQDMLKTVPAKIREQSALAGLDRQYTLSEIAIITRAGPGADPGPEEQGPPGPRGRCRHHDLHARPEPRNDVRAASLRDQGGPCDRRARRYPRGILRQDAARRTRIRPRGRARYPEMVRGLLLDPVAKLPGGCRSSARPRGDQVNAVVNAGISRCVEMTPMTETIAALQRQTRLLDQGYVRRGVSDDGRAADRDGRHPGLGRDRRPDDDGLCDQRDRLRRRGGRSSACSTPGETPDGRPGVSVLVFAFSRDALEKAVANRVGQCVMTCPTTACYNGLPVGEKTISVGGKLRYFGDGWQISKRIGPSATGGFPVMDGEFLCEETFGTVKGVAGGNIILMGKEPAATLAAAEAAVAAMRRCPDVILPFPGGMARSGSKVGSKYKALRASTNTAFAPTLRGVVPTEMPAGCPLRL